MTSNAPSIPSTAAPDAALGNISSSATTTPVVLPELGEDVHEVTLSRWLKHVGEAIRAGEPLLEVETDKITTEVTATTSGVLTEVRAVEGAHVQIGAVVGTIGIGTGPMPATETPSPVEMTAETAAAGALSQPSPAKYTGRISPVVSRMAAEHHLNLDDMTGTGEGGRITKADVEAYIDKRAASSVVLMPSTPSTLPSAPPEALSEQQPASSHEFGGVDEGEDLIPLTAMRRRIAEHMVTSVRTSPHVTTIWDLDFSAVAAHRELHRAKMAQTGVPLTWLAYVVQAAVAALKAHPDVNSQWREAGIARLHDVNIGIATALEDGLVVPVIRHADELSLAGIARWITELATRARTGHLTPSDVQGGTFTITNHGSAGSLVATPIIHQPQCAILGLGTVQKRVRVLTTAAGDVIAIRPCAYLSLTFDHRILDGAKADAFMNTLKQVLEADWSA